MSKYLNVALEVKALENREFEGYGSIFGNVDLGGDVVLRGAFAESLAEHKETGHLPPMFWMHDPSQVPGKWLEMEEDDRGLYVRGELVKTQLGDEMRTLLTKQAVRGLSIGYRVRDFDYDNDGIRLLKNIELWETSIVSLAMNPLAEVEGAKSRLSAAGEYVPTTREFERHLRDLGCSKRVAQKLISTAYSSEGISEQKRRDSEAGEGGEVGAADIYRLAARIAAAR